MNKKIILPFVAILVLAVAMVGAASADEVTTVDTVEVRGNVINVSDTTTLDVWADGVVWDATKFAAFWYELDEGLSTETLTLENETIKAGDTTIDEGNLVYKTEPAWQKYELYADKDLVVEGDDTELSTGYYIEGWMAEKYVAVNGNADELVKLLVEFEGDDKKTLSTGEAWDLGSGFTLTAKQIDLEGNKVLLSLEQDGKELDSEVIETGGSDANDSVYTYTEDLAGEDDVPVFSCLVKSVFRGTDSNSVQVQYVFLIDNDVMEIESDKTYGSMEVVSANGKEVILKNEDNTLDLSKDSKEHIMGNMYFRTADADHIRFYPFVEYTIGEVPGEADDAGEVDTPTDNETDDANVTPTDVVSPTPDPSPTVSGDDTTPVDNKTDAETTETKKPGGIPGFEAGFAIAGLLAVAYLVLRQRE